MLWLLTGTAILGVLLLALRAFERASVTSIHSLLRWIAALGGITLTLLLFLSGRGPQALAGLVMVGPLLWRRWQQWGGRRANFGGGSAAQPPRTSSAMTRQEAYDVLGLKQGASPEDIHAAHRRLMLQRPMAVTPTAPANDTGADHF